MAIAASCTQRVFFLLLPNAPHSTSPLPSTPSLLRTCPILYHHAGTHSASLCRRYQPPTCAARPSTDLQVHAALRTPGERLALYTALTREMGLSGGDWGSGAQRALSWRA